MFEDKRVGSDGDPMDTKVENSDDMGFTFVSSTRGSRENDRGRDSCSQHNNGQ